MRVLLLLVLGCLTVVLSPLPAAARVADRPEDKPKTDKPKSDDRPSSGESSDPVSSYEPAKPDKDAPKSQGGGDAERQGGSGNGKAGDQHGKAGGEHGKAGENGKGGENGKAGDEHGKAGDEHGKAGAGDRPEAVELDGHAEPPAVGRRVVATPAGPPVFVRLPGQAAVQQLTAADDLPVGAVVDTTHGAVVLRTALPGGKEQVAAFHGGRFEVRQSRDGMVDLHLRGSGPDCGAARAARAGGKRRRGAPKRLWGYDDHGRFRTFGRDSVATVRGTAWMVEERCDGTVTKVLWGAVDVRDRSTGRVVRVRAGKSHLARRAR